VLTEGRTFAPKAFATCEVVPNPGQRLRREVRLLDALSDLPPVSNDEARAAIPYATTPRTQFQRYCRAASGELCLDHNPMPAGPDNLFRLQHLPAFKGACWRHLGVLSTDGNAEPTLPGSTTRVSHWHVCVSVSVCVLLLLLLLLLLHADGNRYAGDASVPVEPEW
jgi:hypothetical protein